MGQRQPKRIIYTLEACTEASALLRKAGFQLVCASMQSEATYYRFPGRNGVIRVSTHTGGRPIGLDRVVAKLTFHPHLLCKEPDAMVVTEDALHGMVCGAIGRYFLASGVSP